MLPQNPNFKLLGIYSVALVLWSYTASVAAFNLSPKPNIIIKDPGFVTDMKKYESSYFGFSLNLRPLGIIIGAPRAQSTIEAQRNINETGAIYRCSLQGTNKCNTYIFESRGNFDSWSSESYTYDSEKRDFQWLGAAIDGGPSDTDKLIVCAPRYITPAPNDYLMHGICYWINNTLAENPTNVTKISPLRLKQDQVSDEDGERIYKYMLAEQGLSVHVTPDNEQFIIGAPGIHTWKGSVIRYRKLEENDEPSLSRRDTERALRNTRQSDTQPNQMTEYKTDIPNPKNFKQPSDSYFGYSVSSGYFDSNDRNKLMYVATAPQADEQSGEAYIFDFTKDSITKAFVFRGTQFGEYFGYAALAEDVNGDGLTDVIISAPQYSISGSFDDGAIYVFINQGRLNFERKLIMSPFHGKARFGTTITKLGDINRDGFNDIAVGAPFAGNGSVFVYLGNANGLREQYSQRFNHVGDVQTSYGTAMFGHGLSKGSDIDNNGFNDFAIGAPNAEMVFLYRSYPVVSIKATISSQTREIKPEQTSMPVTVCYSISTASTKMASQDLNLHVVLDSQVKRVKITSTNSNEMKFKVTATKQSQCQILDCNVRFSAGDIFKPIEMELHYELVQGVPNTEVFCETCAAVDPAEPRAYTQKVIFSTGCATEICVADMQVKSNVNHTFILGSSSRLSISYQISNNGETAYLPQINVTSSNRMPFAQIPSNCKLNNQDTMLCDLNHGQPMAKGSKDAITIVYDVSKITGESMTLSAKVFSTGKESNSFDNVASDVITLSEFTEIIVVGAPTTENINLEKVSGRTEVLNVYEIKSNGPSNIESVRIIFDIPVAYTVPGTSKVISIVDMNNITMQAVYDKQIKDVEFYQNNTQILMNAIEKTSSFSTQFTTKVHKENGNGMHYNAINMGHVNEFTVKEESMGDSVLSASMSHSRRRRDATALTANKEHYARISNAKSYELLGEDLKGTLPVNRTIVFNCNDPEMTMCVRAVIPLYNFKRDTPLTVTMKYHVDLKEVNQILIEPWEFFVIVVGVDIQKPSDPLGQTLALTKKIEYNIISKHQLYGTPIWIIILAVLGGLLALALITYGMYRAGFFKRATKEEMDKLVHQAKLSSDGVTEASNLNTDNN